MGFLGLRVEGYWGLGFRGLRGLGFRGFGSLRFGFLGFGNVCLGQAFAAFMNGGEGFRLVYGMIDRGVWDFGLRGRRL